MSNDAVLARQSHSFAHSARCQSARRLSKDTDVLIAGHETTSTARAWTLFGLSANLEAQRKLREELLTPYADSPTMDDLKTLKYLDMVVREALRLWSPISSSKRVAVKDVLLPLRDGRVVKLNEGNEVRIVCGSSLMAAHLAIRSIEAGDCDAAVITGCQHNHRYAHRIPLGSRLLG